MKQLLPLLAALSTFGCNQNANSVKKHYQWPAVPAPSVEKHAKEFVLHNDKRIDEFYWLNERENPKVLDYLKAENAYTDTMLSGTKALQQKLFAEMKGRIKEKDESVPYKDNGYFYYTRYEQGAQYPVYCRKKGSLDATEEVLLDQNKMATGHSFYAIGGRQVSDNNELLAYTVDTVSRRLYSLHFRNLLTGEDFPEAIPNVEGGSLAWAADNKTAFYIKKDTTTLLGYQVWRHQLGTDPKNDVLVYEEKDNRFYMGLYRTKSKKYIAILSDMNEVSTEYHLLEASHPEGQFSVFQPRQHNFQYYIEHYNDKFYIRTDWNAPNFRLMETPDKLTGRDNWKEVIPHREAVYMSNITVFRDHLVIGELKDALNQLRVMDLKNKTEHYIQFDETAYTAFVNTNPDFNTDTLRFSYTSLTTPFSIYDYNMNTKQRVLKKQTEVLGGFKKENYQSERLWAPARDGAKVPISLVYKKGMEKNGANPLLLYGYGAYGYSNFPMFNSNIISLLDRGFIFAIVHVRGGQELGRAWYENGRMMKKKNTFYDFIDGGEFLIKEKYTSKEHLYANGGSAGGLLIGAAVNFRPDLWHGVIAEVPFVDVLTTMSDASIPLTTGEYEEWGNPADSTQYFYMKSYSPYDNVEKKEYPNMLVTTGLHDSQVQYFEPAKWVARLREMKTDKNVLLFKINMAAGHGGASGRFDYLKDEALQYAFLLALENRVE